MFLLRGLLNVIGVEVQQAAGAFLVEPFFAEKMVPAVCIRPKDLKCKNDWTTKKID